MTQTEIFTLLIAGYGALLSTIVLIWNIFRHKADQACLALESDVGEQILISPGKPLKVVHIRITNVGNRPTHIVNIGGISTSGYFVITPHNRLPCKIEPSQILDETIGIEQIANPEGIVDIFVIASAKKRYGLSIKQVLQLQRDVLNAQRNCENRRVIKLHRLIFHRMKRKILRRLHCG